MAVTERLLGLKQSFLEIESEGGQVWVEAKSSGHDCLLCFHFGVGGILSVFSVMVPGVSAREVHNLAKLMKIAWEGEIVSHGTIAGNDPRGTSRDFSSYYVSIEPSSEAKAAAPVVKMSAVVDNLDRLVQEPAIVSARVVHSEGF